MKKVDLSGAPALAICDVGTNPRRGSWNRDGIIIFSASSLGPIAKVPASGGTAVPVTTLDVKAGETTHRWASFLPDGKHFLYTVGTHSAGTKSETNAIYVASIDSHDKTLLFRARSNAAYASGHLLYVRDRVLVAQPFDAKNLRFTGDPVPVVQDVRYETSFFLALFSVSDNGALVYQSGAGEANVPLSFFDRSGKVTEAVDTAAPFRGVTLSPDSRQVAEVIEDPGTGVSGIWLLDVARHVRTRFSFGPSDQTSPLWSPDGTRLVYTSVTGSAANLYIKDINGSGTPEPLVVDTTVKAATSWSADGRFLAYDSNDFASKNRSDIWIVPMTAGGKPFPFLRTPTSESGATFSPDGHWISYESDESGRLELYIVPFPAGVGKWQVSTNGALGSHWRKDGGEIIYFAPDVSQFMAVTVEAKGKAISIGTPVPLFDPSRSMGRVDITADHNRILLAMTPSARQDEPITLVTNWPATLHTVDH